MKKDNHGHIVTIASVAGLLGTYNCTDYSATKFAAIGFHESLFTELKVIIATFYNLLNQSNQLIVFIIRHTDTMEYI